MNYSFFLSKDTPFKARDIFNDKSERKIFSDRVRDAKSYIFSSDWSSFEETYLAIYTLILSGDLNWVSDDRDITNSISFQTLLDIDLVDRESDLGVPDQFSVFDVIRLRERLLDMFPVGTRVTEIGVGCALLGFSIPVSDSYSRNEAGREEFERDLKSYLIDNGWDKLERRFKVADYHPK